MAGTWRQKLSALTEAEAQLAGMFNECSSPLRPLLKRYLDNLHSSVPSRLQRSVCLRLAACLHKRFTLYYDNWPSKWAGFHTFTEQEQCDFLKNLAKTPLCCWDKLFTYRSAARVVRPGHWEHPELLARDLLALRCDDFKQVLRSWEEDFDSMHTMRNEMDHALLRQTLKQLKRGTRPPKAGHVFAHHYCKKVRFAFERFRLSRNLPAKAKRTLPSTTLVSRAVNMLRKATSGKRTRRSVKTGVAHGLRTPFLNEKKKMHKLRHGRVSNDTLATLRSQWNQEFDHMTEAETEALRARLESRRQVARDVARITRPSRRARARQDRLEASAPDPPPQVATPELPSLFQLGDEYPVTPSVVREQVLQASGHDRSYLAAAHDVFEGKLPAPSLGHMTVPAAAAFNVDDVSRFRVSNFTCKDKHPGLCATRDARHLAVSLSLAKQVSRFLSTRVCEDEVGSALVRLSAFYDEAGEDGSPLQEHYHLFVADIQKRPQREVFVMTIPADEDAEGADSEPKYPMECALLIDGGKLVCRTNFAVARHVSKRAGLRSANISMVKYQDCPALGRVLALGVESHAELNVGKRPGASPMPVEDPFAAALDAIVRADRAPAGIFLSLPLPRPRHLVPSLLSFPPSPSPSM